MFHEIPFLPVKAAAKNKGLRFTVDAADVPAMNVWLMPGDTVGSGDYQTFMAQLCATQIRDWLSAGQRGALLLWRGETSRPVQASDITVLVRNRLEAAQVREALQTLGIPSVYLSNRDSVLRRWRPRSCSGYCRRCWPRSGKIPCAARWRRRCLA